MPAKKDPNNHDLPEELQACLKQLVDEVEKEDSWVRKQQLKTWKKAEEFWHGIQYIFWSETRQDWVSPTNGNWFQDQEGREGAEGPFYDFVINIYRAHGESIIAAMSAQVPAVRFPPDNADDEDDLMTSKTFSKIADLIQRHNKAKLLVLKALMIFWNQGTVYAYHPPKADEVFGVTHVPNYKDKSTCSACGYEEDTEQSTNQCPQCGQELQTTTVLDGFTSSPKSRVLIDLYSPLNVKVSYSARNQAECGYLDLKTDQPVALMKHSFPHIADKIDSDIGDTGDYDKVARAPSTHSRIEENRNNITFRRTWLRPYLFENLPKGKEAEKKKLIKLFPDGCYVGHIGTVYAESRNECFDKYWTIGQATLSTYIHCDSIGNPLMSPQEMRNVLTNLTLDTIEHGIPNTYADSETVDFETYSQHESRPGVLYPVKRKPGENISSSFYESSRASISKETSQFGAQLDKDGQFVSGSFPSIYGGPSSASSRTASEYNQSRQMALQRLSLAWTLLSYFWADMIEKCVKIYISNMLEDEKYTIRENNSYQTVWIKQAELTGHVGEVESEGSDSFPVSSPQKQTLLMKLMELNNEFLNAALFDTENRKILADSLSFPDFNIPGEDQRIKQARETQEMLKGAVIEPEFDVDDHATHISSLKHFMVSNIGLDLKRTDPMAYERCRLHLMIHNQMLTQQTQQQFQDATPGQAPGGVQ